MPLALPFQNFACSRLAIIVYRGADKSLSRPGTKQVTATKLFYKPLKKKTENCPSNQVSAATMTSASDEKWRPFNCFFQSGRAKDLSAPQGIQNPSFVWRAAKYMFSINYLEYRSNGSESEVVELVKHSMVGSWLAR